MRLHGGEQRKSVCIHEYRASCIHCEAACAPPRLRLKAEPLAAAARSIAERNMASYGARYAYSDLSSRILRPEADLAVSLPPSVRLVRPPFSDICTPSCASKRR